MAIDQATMAIDKTRSDATGIAAPADALAQLRTLIGGDRYAVGDRLPPERVLIDQLDVTRSKLRRALETLENEGLIWRRVGKGTFVGSGDNANDDPSTDANGHSPFENIDDLRGKLTPMRVMRARQCIEPALAREAAINASASAINLIQSTHEASCGARSWNEYEDRDDQFHHAVAEASDNALLVAIFEQLNGVRRAVGWTKLVRQSDRPGKNHRSYAEHRRILEAIEARDPAAAQETMRAHINSVSARLFGEL